MSTVTVVDSTLFPSIGSIQYVWSDKDVQNDQGIFQIRSNCLDNGHWKMIHNDTIKTMYYDLDLTGKTDVTHEVQKIIDLAYYEKVSVIHFSPGIYLLSELYYYPGHTYTGTSETLLLKKPNSPRYNRIFANKKTKYKSHIDSDPVTFKHLHFDGQAEKQGKV